jgi:hypothetical protein
MLIALASMTSLDQAETLVELVDDCIADDLHRQSTQRHAALAASRNRDMGIWKPSDHS